MPACFVFWPSFLLLPLVFFPGPLRRRNMGRRLGGSPASAALLLIQSAHSSRQLNHSVSPASGLLLVGALLETLPRRRRGKTAQGNPAATAQPGSVGSQLRY